MKTFLLIAVLLVYFVGPIAIAQAPKSETRIKLKRTPKEIVSYIDENYPDARVKYYQWQAQNDSVYYHVKMKYERELMDLTFNADGVLIRKDSAVHYSVVPANVKAKINEDLKSRYLKFSIHRCKILHIDNQKFYEVEITAKEKTIKKKYLFRFSADGIMIDFLELAQKPIGPIFH